MRLMLFAVLLLTLSPAFAGDRVVQFADAVATLTDKPCHLGDSELKTGRVDFKDKKIASRKFCWIEEDGLIWVIDGIMVFNFTADNAKPDGLDI